MNTLQRRILLAVLAAALLSLSCSLPVGIGSKIRQTVENTISTGAALQPTAILETVKTAAAAVESTADSLTGSIPGNNTSLLDSYRLSFNATSSGTGDTGNAITLIMERTEEVDNIRSIRHYLIHIEGTGAAANSGNVDIYQQNGQSYMYYADNQENPCLSVGTAGDLLSSSSMNPEDFVQSVEPGELLESNVIINDIATDHYRVKNSGLGISEAQFTAGEVWVARDGNYIVRFTGTADGRVSDGTNQGTGTTEWVYNLYDINRVSEIVIPEACLKQQESMTDIPVPDNAVNTLKYTGIITFDSADKPEQVSTFYKAKLQDQGWLLIEEANTAGVLMLEFDKESQSLQIMITPKPGSGSSVIITSIALK